MSESSRLVEILLMEEIRRSPVEVGSYHDLQGFIRGAGFLSLTVFPVLDR